MSEDIGRAPPAMAVGQDEGLPRPPDPEAPLVSVIIPSWGRPDELNRCVSSVLKSSYRPLEIVVVDSPRNAAYSSDGIDSAETGLRVYKSPARLYTSAARNRGIALSKGQILFFVDNDNILPVESISRLAAVLVGDSSIGFVGPVAYYKYDPSRVWSAGAYKSKFFRRHTPKRFAPDGPKLYDVDVISNAFMTRRDVLDRIGPFDAINFTIQEEDAELQIRARRGGFRTVILTNAATYHDIDPSPTAHFTSEGLRAGFRGRFWEEKKHDRRNVLGFGLFALFLIPYYFLLASLAFLETRSDPPLVVFSAAIRGIAEGLFREPA